MHIFFYNFVAHKSILIVTISKRQVVIYNIGNALPDFMFYVLI